MDFPESEKAQVSNVDTEVVNQSDPHSGLHHVAVHGVVDNVQLFQRAIIQGNSTRDMKLTRSQRIQVGRSPKASSYHGLPMILEIPWCVRTVVSQPVAPD